MAVAALQIVVVGGGMVGAAAALALAHQGHQVTLLEAAATPLLATDEPWDLRISSIHHGNLQWLAGLGLATGLQGAKCTPYQQLSVITCGGQRLAFDADELGLDALGAMIENHYLQGLLWQALRQQPRVTLLSNQQLQQLDLQHAQVQVDGQWRAFDLLLGADGMQSTVAQLAQLGVRGWDYAQHCLLALAETEQAQPAATWEIFRPQGPYALLPLAPQQVCLIDYAAPNHWQQQQQMGQVEACLAAQFTPHIGPFKVLRWGSFPLRRQHALRYRRSLPNGAAVALLGDAAHSIHPLAGQGVNLGFADVQTLLQSLQQHEALEVALADYERQRQRANQQMMRAMDLIYATFQQSQLLPQALVAAAFTTLQRVTPLKQWLLKQAVGAR